jgi:SAM-dependent methyltransferase
MQNDKNGIIENVLFHNSLIHYDLDYDNEQANSTTFKNHLQEVIEILIPFSLNKKVVEIGCGKGYFLELFRKRGVDIVGCDPTYDGVNKNVIKEFFSSDLGLKGDLIILRHVLEHVENPINFIFEIAKANDNKGLIYIEVPEFNWILENNTFFDIFYEHVNYFTYINFMHIFGNIISSGVFFGGQYQYVIASLTQINYPPYKFQKIDSTISFYRFESTLAYLSNIQKNIYIWGAASKGIIYNIYLHNRNITSSTLIDINPKKQNKFAPITGTRIISPQEFILEKKNCIVFIANPNYRNEIIEFVNDTSV